MRIKIVAGNWKMNLDLQSSVDLAKEVNLQLQNKNLDGKRVLIAPNFAFLQKLASSKEINHLEFASQNIHHEASGAYTGEVSAE